jgi:membrane protein YqaA with SNARE-associated domain
LTEILIVVAASFGVGFASAFIPPVNAELLTVAAVATVPLVGGIAAVVAVTTGQTIGKVVVYEATRAGRQVAQRHRERLPLGTEVVEDLDPARREEPVRRVRPRWRAFKAWVKRWSDRGLSLMNTRARCLGILAISATVGFPPLLLTTVAAGAVKMHRVDFILVTLFGRLIRFGVVAWPMLALRS